MSNWYISLIILLIILGGVFYYNPQILSKITSFTFGTTPIGDITTNFQNYENKNVTILGTYAINLMGDRFLVDEQNYNIKILCEDSNRVFNLGETYKATGIVTFDAKCYCQQRYVLNITEEEWETLVNETRSEYGISIYKQNISTLNPDYMLLPSPEEGWSEPFYFLGKDDVLGCTASSINWLDYPFQIILNDTHGLQSTTAIIKEERCEPDSFEKDYYFKCTEPMIKIA